MGKRVNLDIAVEYGGAKVTRDRNQDAIRSFEMKLAGLHGNVVVDRKLTGKKVTPLVYPG